MIRYAITDSSSFGTNVAAREQALVAQAARLKRARVDYIQLREKDMEAGALFSLACAMSAALRGSSTKLFINGRADVAAASSANGVHLTAHPDELRPEQVRQVFELANAGRASVSASCHTVAEVEQARTRGADMILFGPVFEKRVGGELVVEGVRLRLLRAACEAAGSVPVLALGGVTEVNAPQCMGAGAAGVASIRLFR